MAKKNTSKPVSPKGHIGESKKEIDSYKKSMEIPPRPKTSDGDNKK